MGSYTLEIAIVFFVFAIVLYLLKIKEFAMKSFVIAIFALASPLLPVFKNIVFSLFPIWFSIVLTIVITIVILRYALAFFFGESTIHILANLVSVSAKGFVKLVTFIPKLILNNQWLHVNAKKLGRGISHKSKGLASTTGLTCKKVLTSFKTKKVTSSEEPIIRVHKEDDDV